jgi:hypothetical protein
MNKLKNNAIFTVKFSLEGLKLHMTNLFGGAQTLGNSINFPILSPNCNHSLSLSPDEDINKYLNDNWKLAAEALKPIISKTIEDIMLFFQQKVFHLIPGDYFVEDLATLIR